MCRTAVLITILAVLPLVATCSYGPPQDRAVAYVQRVPGRAEVVAAVHHERFRPAAGLRAFPSGGVARSVLNEVRVYWASAVTGEVREWAHIPLTASLHSVAVGMAGIGADTVYVITSGCSGRTTECWGDMRQQLIHRVTRDSAVTRVERVPARHRPAGGSEAPMRGEEHYLRASGTQRDSLMVRVSYPSGRALTIARIRPTGELEPLQACCSTP